LTSRGALTLGQDRATRLVCLGDQKARLTNILSLRSSPANLEAWAKKALSGGL